MIGKFYGAEKSMSKSPSGRRDFLNPLKAIKSFREEAGEAEIQVPTPTFESVDELEDSCLLYVSKRAMACTFQIYFTPENGDAIAEVAIEALELVEQLENQMTVYRSSPMTYLNETAASEPVRIESRIYQLLKKGHELFELTDRAFDMTSGLLTKGWGFFRQQGRVPDEREIAALLNGVGSQHLIFDDQNETIAFRQRDLELNLGGIGKGHAIDRAAQFMTEHGIEHFLIHGGQSSVLARGNRWSRKSSKPTAIEDRSTVQDAPTKENLNSEAASTQKPIDAVVSSEPWKVGLRHPTQVENRIAEICLTDRAIGTSGTGRQSFYHKGKRYGHIIDPRSGQPCEGVFSATAIAPTAAEADALATAFYVMGPDKAVEFCKSNSEYGCVMISPGKSNKVRMDHHGISEDELQIAMDD